MGDDDDRPLELAQEFLEPADREDVEVVRGLVEEEDIRRACEDLRQQHPELEAAGEGRERPAVDLAGEAEALEDLAGASLRGVAVVSLEGLLEFREPVGVEGPVFLRDQSLALDHRPPEFGVSHERDAEDRVVLVQEVVLPEDAEPESLRHADGALGRIFGAAEDVEQRRLAGAVGAHESVALAGVEQKGRVAEEDLASERLPQARDGDHRRREVAGGSRRPRTESRFSRTRSCGCSSSRGSRAAPPPPGRAACAGRGRSPCRRSSGRRGSRR